MENRFGIKDFFLFAILLLVIVLIVLGMKQVDRQWQTLTLLQDKTEQQGRDLIAIRKSLAEGVMLNSSPAVPLSPTTQSTNVSADGKSWSDPFKLLKEAEKMP